MDKARQYEVLDTARRRFLTQVAATGAAAGTAAALPAWAQEESARPAAAAESSGRSPIAETFARYAAGLRYEDLPADLVRQTKRITIDTLGCAIGAYRAEPSQIAVKLAGGISATQGATVFCNGLKTSHELAAFANGVMIRYLDFNDGYISLGNGHPSDVIGALLATAEVAGRSGRDLILATVLAYEVFTRVVDVMDIKAVGMDSATVAGLAGLVGTCRLMGLTQQQMVHAIGIYVAGNAAANQTRRGTLSNWKACASADACRKGIFAAQLAQAGMTGPNQVFEGREGFFNLTRLKPFKLAKFGGGGEPFGMIHTFTKRFALGQYAQTVAQAALEARPFFKDVSEIQEVNVRVSQRAIRTMADSADKWRPQTRETADHSMPYATAVALRYGEIDEQYYDDEFLHDQRLLDLVGRVRCIPSEEADRREPEINLCELEIVLKSGQRKTVRVEYHRGHWKNPMTDAEVDEKFRGLARKQLTAQKTDALLKQLWTLEEMPKAGALAAMTRA